MHYRQKKINTVIESNIATGMITSDRYLKEIQAFFRPEFLKTNYIKIVAKWCIDYFNQYNKAPNTTIQEMFDTYVRQGLDETEAKLISTFLETISEAYDENYNIQYMLDQAELYFRKRALEALAADITTSTTTNNIQEAEALIPEFKRPIRPSTKGINPLTNAKAIKDAFNMKQEYLFKLPGAWGDLVGPITRGDFYAIFSPFKRGKSFNLLEIAIIAIKQNCKTLFVSLEMTEAQVMRRLFYNIMEETKEPRLVAIPILDCLLNQINGCALNIRTGNNIHSVEGNAPSDHIPCTACTRGFKPLVYYTQKQTKGTTHKEAVKCGRLLQQKIGLGEFKLICFPGKSINMNDFKSCLDNLEFYENFVADIIITDYADFFAPTQGNEETRHQINKIWEIHRAIAQERNCAVITASHTNKATLTRDIEQGDSAEDSRKMNHVTKASSLNQTPEEKKKGIMRTSMLAQREEDFNPIDEVVILQQLAIGKFYLDSYKKPYKEKKK